MSETQKPEDKYKQECSKFLTELLEKDKDLDGEMRKDIGEYSSH